MEENVTLDWPKQLEPANEDQKPYLKELQKQYGMDVYQLDPYVAVFKIRGNVWAMYAPCTHAMGDNWLYLIEGPEKALFIDNGWGFGDLRNASENMVFYDGKAYKLGTLEVTRDPANYMADWHFVSDDRSFDLVMEPFYDNFTQTKILVIDIHCHQVHGFFSGTVHLPGGKTLELKKVPAFCEHAENRW
jgi:hypothetical protein